MRAVGCDHDHLGAFEDVEADCKVFACSGVAWAMGCGRLICVHPYGTSAPTIGPASLFVTRGTTQVNGGGILICYPEQGRFGFEDMLGDLGCVLFT